MSKDEQHDDAQIATPELVRDAAPVKDERKRWGIHNHIVDPNYGEPYYLRCEICHDTILGTTQAPIGVDPKTRPSGLVCSLPACVAANAKRKPS
jgi:hypothetical protein